VAGLAIGAGRVRGARAGGQGGRAGRGRRLSRAGAPAHGATADAAAQGARAAVPRGAAAVGARSGRAGGAAGERLYSRWDVRPLLEGPGCVDVLQPDVCHVGGISELRRIVAMAETYDVAVAPHCPLGPIAPRR
jgi:hypothetical protein